MCIALLPYQLFSEKEKKKNKTNQTSGNLSLKKTDNFKYHVMIDIQRKNILYTEETLIFSQYCTPLA